MNRPLAIAVATLVVSIGVFFAGFMLIVEPTSKVTFPPELAVMTPTAGQTRVAQVRVDLGATGKTARSTTKAKPKTVKRASSIGANSGPNVDNGLAGSSSGSSSTSVGAQSGTPGGTTSP